MFKTSFLIICLLYRCIWPMLPVESKLLVDFCYFECIISVISCSLMCLLLFHLWSLSLDYILLISAKILVLLVTLFQKSNENNTNTLCVYEIQPKTYKYHTRFLFDCFSWINSLVSNICFSYIVHDCPRHVKYIW